MSDRADGRPAHTAQMRDHWWWRPGWRVGRRFYTWFLTFEGQHDVRRLAQVYQDRLDVQSLDPGAFGVAAPDDAGSRFRRRGQRRGSGAGRERRRSSLRLPGIAHVDVGAARATSEGVVLDVAPTEPVCALRETLRAAIADVWSVDRVPETGREFVPHVSLAYSNTAAPAAPVVEAVKSVSARPAGLTVTAAHMIVLSRDARVYHWEVFATVGLGG